ncbi:MAG: response regulator [Pseudomonadota bacterium]
MDVLIIDDEDYIRNTLSDYLEDSGMQTRTASNGKEGLKAMDETLPDIVLVDLNMPVMDGYTFLRRVTDHHGDLPVVVLSGVGLVAEAMKAIKAGAWDFISKPVSDMEVVVHAIDKCMEKARLTRENRNYQENLEELVRQRTAQIEMIKHQTLHCLGKASEFKDNETGNHVLRVGAFSWLMAKGLGFDESFCHLVRQAAPMHDVGKIGIADRVLLKNGKLDEREWEHMKSHVRFGCEILSPAVASDPASACQPDCLLNENGPTDVLEAARRIALFHHERWDGKGYMHGLKGVQIPVEARIVSIADVYDAVSSKRPYKDPYPEEKCQSIIREGRKTQFDPDIVAVFFDTIDRIVEIKQGFKD